MSDMNDKDMAQLRILQDGVGPQPEQRYRHYKGGEYEIVCRSVKEDTLEQLVTYRSLLKGGTWTRTLDNFLQHVYPANGEVAGQGPGTVARFERIN